MMSILSFNENLPIPEIGSFNVKMLRKYFKSQTRGNPQKRQYTQRLISFYAQNFNTGLKGAEYRQYNNRDDQKDPSE